jgi:hypothetical protein
MGGTRVNFFSHAAWYREQQQVTGGADPTIPTNYIKVISRNCNK